MSFGNPERFPWGENNPGARARMLAALSFALLACLALLLTFVEHPSRHTDFSNVWFAAKALLEGRNPYPLIGPGRELDMQYPLIYPAPSFVLVLPFAFLGEKIAALRHYKGRMAQNTNPPVRLVSRFRCLGSMDNDPYGGTLSSVDRRSRTV